MFMGRYGGRHDDILKIPPARPVAAVKDIQVP
jgi:hypothetical protein